MAHYNSGSDDYLDFPLYHGTSTLFLESIKKYGLGGKNPINQLGVLKTLERAMELADFQLRNDEVFQINKWVFTKHLNQCSDRENWQHGQLYASASEFKATQYATSNAYGSELISDTINLYRRIPDKSSLSLDENPILRLSSERYNPLVYRIDNYPIRALGSEKANRNILDDITLLRNANDVGFMVLSQGLNFRLFEPVAYKELKPINIDKGVD